MKQTRLVWAIVAIGVAVSSTVTIADVRAQERKSSTEYSNATRGVVDFSKSVKILLDESNLGGKEVEMAEMTFAAGMKGDQHRHKTVEIFYVLSGTLGHEVNGQVRLLTPGMVGVVRPQDTVRHFVPEGSEAKALVIWAPAGELKNTGAPLRCSDGQIPAYKGTGDAKDAASFECK